MKNMFVHHIHVRYGEEVYTLTHESGYISFKTLRKFIKDIENKGV